jgi:hypothetical protein
MAGAYYKLNLSIIDQIETKDNNRNIFVDTTLLSTLTFDILANEKLIDQTWLSFPLNVEEVMLRNISISKKTSIANATKIVDPLDTCQPATTEWLYIGFTDYQIPAGTTWQDNRHFITENTFVIPIGHNNAQNIYGEVLPINLPIKFSKNSTYVNLFMMQQMYNAAAGTDVSAVQTGFLTHYSQFISSGPILIYNRYNIFLNFQRLT